MSAVAATTEGRRRPGVRALRASVLPMPEHMSQAEAMTWLHPQVFRDACAAGWLVVCARKGAVGGGVFYRTVDVRAVSARIAGGEYPGEALKMGGAK